MKPVILLIVILLVAGGLIAWAAIGGGDCPKGQSLHVTAYIPVKVGTTVTVQPVYACERNQ